MLCCAYNSTHLRRGREVAAGDLLLETTKPEVIRATALERGPHLLRGLWLTLALVALGAAAELVRAAAAPRETARVLAADADEDEADKERATAEDAEEERATAAAADGGAAGLPRGFLAGSWPPARVLSCCGRSSLSVLIENTY